MSKQYILVTNCQCLCDPSSYDDVLDMLNKYYSDISGIEMVEYVKPIRNNIDYSVLDMY